MTFPVFKLTVFALLLCATGAQAQPTPATAQPASHSLITGESAQVTKGDFDQEIKNIPENSRIEFLTSLPRIQRLLQRIFLNKAAAAKAIEEGFDKDPAVVAELEYTRQNKLASLYMDRIRNAIKVPDLGLRAREMFLVNAEKLATPEMVRASHILISVQKHSREEARKLAENVRKKALAGENFEKLAETYSEDRSAAENKGDLGFFTSEKMVPEFSQAAFALKNPGDISQPVESPFGYHIIRLTARTASRPAVYEEHRREFLLQAEKDYRDAEFTKIITLLVDVQKPRPDEQAVEQLRMKIDMNDAIRQQMLKQQQEAAEKK